MLLNRIRVGQNHAVPPVHISTDARRRAAVAEFVGTAFLLIAVIGSGIMAEQLSSDTGLVLFQNAFATAGALLALILAFAGVSGAHFNPVVTLAQVSLGSIDRTTAAWYVLAQFAGGVIGAIAANIMFELDPIHWSTRDRSSTALLVSEVIATLGLLLVIHGVVRTQQSKASGHSGEQSPTAVALAVAGYIGGAYFFTSSTSFANPAVTVARTLSDTFAGIEPASAPGFIAAQLVGAAAAIALITFLWPSHSD